MGVMILNAARALGISYNMGNELASMNDRAEVSSWAREGVSYVFGNGIIVGDGVRFNPKGITTVEQAVAIVNRVYKNYEHINLLNLLKMIFIRGIL